MLLILRPGDEVIIPEPFYANYNGFAISVGVSVKPTISVIDNGFALPPIEEFEKVITPKQAIMICNPNNLQDICIRQELESLAKIVKTRPYLFADEVYREFVTMEKKHSQ